MRGDGRSRALVGMAAAAALLFPAPAALAQKKLEVPPNDGWVTDLAGFLTPQQERALEETMESFRRGSGHDVALLTVPSLQGEPIENFALRVARAWKLGSAERNDGALLVVSRSDREMRIEVGRGLEGTLTDATSGRIIRDVITPRFQRGDYADGLRLGVEAMQHAAGGDYAPLDRYSESHGPRGIGFLPAGLIFLFILMAVARARRNRFGGGSIWPWLVVANSLGRPSRGGWGGGSGGGGGGFGGFGGGGGFSGGGASGRW